MQVTQNVNGIYHGIKFSGRISEMRRLTVKTDGCFEFMVTLDQPITFFGTQRERLCIHAKFDGAPSSYSSFNDALLPA